MSGKVTYLELSARVLMSCIFLIAGVGKIGSMEATQAYMASFGLPALLLAPTIAFEIGAGLMFALGLFTRHVALALAGFTLLSAAIFHTEFSDQAQTVLFLKNLAMTGGLLMFVAHGSAGLSIDARRRARS